MDLVFEGGGVKGMGLVGAYSVLEERGYEPVNMAGSSAGAVMAALAAAGYTAEELHGVMTELDFSQFMDRGWEDFIPFLPRAASMMLDHGVYEGKWFQDWMSKLLKQKVNERLEKEGKEPLGPDEEVTFGHLVRDDAGDLEDLNLTPKDRDKYRYKLQVIVSDVTKGRMLVLPRDAESLGYHHPDYLPVALAVRASMSIPLFFEPLAVTDNAGNKRVLVDGGMLSNFPVWLFDAPEGIEPRRETLGIKLVEGREGRSSEEGAGTDGAPDQSDASEPEAWHRGLLRMLRKAGPWGYAWSLIETMIEAHDRFIVEQRDFDRRTIAVDSLGVRTRDFHLVDRKKKDDLFESGRKAAKVFFENRPARAANLETATSGRA